MSHLIFTAFGFVLIFIGGYWMNHMGRPYSLISISIHKFLTLGILVYLIFILRASHNMQAFNTEEWTLAITAAVAFVAAMVTGGILNLPSEMPRMVTILHHVLPYASVAATLLLVYRRFWGI